MDKDEQEAEQEKEEQEKQEEQEKEKQKSGRKERWKKASDAIGEPLHEFISRSVTERLKNDYPDVYKELHFDVE